MIFLTGACVNAGSNVARRLQLSTARVVVWSKLLCLRISGALYVVVHCIYTVSKLESFIRKDDTITMFVCKVASVLFIALIYTFTGVVFAYSNRFCLSVCMSVPDIIHIVCVVDRDNL